MPSKSSTDTPPHSPLFPCAAPENCPPYPWQAGFSSHGHAHAHPTGTPHSGLPPISPGGSAISTPPKPPLPRHSGKSSTQSRRPHRVRSPSACSPESPSRTRRSTGATNAGSGWWYTACNPASPGRNPQSTPAFPLRSAPDGCSPAPASSHAGRWQRPHPLPPGYPRSSPSRNRRYPQSRHARGCCYPPPPAPC